VNGDPYTRAQMNAPGSTGVESPTGPFDGLKAEAQAAVGRGANTLRLVREQYRKAYAEEIERWHELREDLAAAERPETSVDGLRMMALRNGLDEVGAARAAHQAELARIELALRHLESTWLFLERDDRTLVGESSDSASATDIQMRIVEAQEAERARLAQEIHDGPAQALSNAIFQVEFVERMLDRDPQLARAELRYLRDLLRRELDDVRGFIGQLRPPLLDALGLDGALRDAIEHAAGLTGVQIAIELDAPADEIGESAQTVALRVAQEALHNVRKHAGASAVSVSTRLEDDAWVLEVSDDGRGFDVDAVTSGGRRSFGLQFMRERARLIGAALEVRSRSDGGTVVRLAVPRGAERNT
jgi:two-component system, NarL family, sensor histidine kinase DegS